MLAQNILPVNMMVLQLIMIILAGMEVSALLGRMPSAVGYQPTLATEMGELEERITSPSLKARNQYPRPGTNVVLDT